MGKEFEKELIYVLSQPKSPFGFFHKIQKNQNKLFCQPNTCITESLCYILETSTHCYSTIKMTKLVTWSCLTLCNPMDCSPPDFSVPGILKNTGVGCHSLLQEIFPTQKWNPGLPHCRHFLYHLSHQGHSNQLYSSIKFKKNLFLSVDFQIRRSGVQHVGFHCVIQMQSLQHINKLAFT